jgi:hypothetical protein
MSRDTDRKKISEVTRQQKLWVRDASGDINHGSGGTYVELVTSTDEALYIEYTVSGQLRRATYRHWDSGQPGHPIVCTKHIKRRKLEVVSELIRTGTFVLEERHYA